MTDGDYDHPSWELAMARKDARLMQDELAGAGYDFIMLPAFAALMDEAIARGDGNRDWNVIARGLV
jgi:3-hydroxyisobutyrate dehydrogenase